MRLVVAVAAATTVDAVCRRRGRAADREDLEESVFTALELANASSALEYHDATTYLATVGALMNPLTEEFDVLLTPTLTTPPVEIGRYASDRGYVEHRTDTLRFTEFLPYFNASGQPAMSVPLHWNQAGLPIGVQFVGGLGREDILFQLASQLEDAQPWFHKTPSLAHGSMA